MKKSIPVDMHVHTTYSDGFSSIKKIEKICKKKKIGVAITDHNEIRGAVELSKKKEILIIPGIEITTSEKIHTLVYFWKHGDLKKFFNQNVKKYKKGCSLTYTFPNLMKKAGKYKCLTSLAHPFSMGDSKIVDYLDKKEYKEAFKKIDCIEIINGWNLKKRNTKAINLAKKNNKSCTGGSDSHTSGTIGNVLTYAENSTTIKEFLDNVNKKKTKVIGKEMNPILALGAILASKIKEIVI